MYYRDNPLVIDKGIGRKQLKLNNFVKKKKTFLSVVWYIRKKARCVEIHLTHNSRCVKIARLD